MKKLLSFLIILTISSLTGCSDESGHENNAGNKLYYSMLNDSNSGSVISPTSNQTYSSISGAPKYEKIDYDFTAWDETLVQTNFYSMESYPSEYINKIVKVSGPFMPYGSVDPNSCYPAIYLFGDATGCCAYCFEFLLYGVPNVCSPAGGDGYPLLKEQATIVGRFDKYYEGSSCYIHLVDAIWVK